MSDILSVVLRKPSRLRKRGDPPSNGMARRVAPLSFMHRAVFVLLIGCVDSNLKAQTDATRMQSVDESTATFQDPRALAFHPSDPVNGDLPRIRKLGKLVSLENGSRGLRTVRELDVDEQGPGLPSDGELDWDPEGGQTIRTLPRLSFSSQEPYSNYRADESTFSFMPGDGNQFGWISFEGQPYLERGYRSGLTYATNMHLLSGPVSVPLPPRLYDFSIGYQMRGCVADVLSYDVASSLGAYSDFEDSAREGVRFPGHAVGMLHYSPETEVVFGIDYLGRDDYKLLPVIGFSFRPRSLERLRFDLVFPRPRIDYTLTGSRKLFVAGKLGGGTWDIEFPNDSNDVMTYVDKQLLVGIETRQPDGDVHTLEFGYVFDRRLEFRTLNGQTEFDDAFVFRLVTRK